MSEEQAPYSPSAFPQPMIECKWCNENAYIKQGRIWLCKKHYRFQQMRVNAKRHGKKVPDYELLEQMLTNPMRCVGCDREMNWLSKDGQSTVITLQHDRSGLLRFLCRACNTRHVHHSEDTFYHIPDGLKRCPRCKEIKPFSKFCIDNSKRWMDRKTYCRKCASLYYKEWRMNQKTGAAR